eukprot:12416975-Karenia_brevis.AAC.1
MPESVLDVIENRCALLKATLDAGVASDSEEYLQFLEKQQADIVDAITSAESLTHTESAKYRTLMRMMIMMMMMTSSSSSSSSSSSPSP